MVPLSTMLLTLAVILSAACMTVEPTGEPSTQTTVDPLPKDQPCESRVVWDGDCMTVVPTTEKTVHDEATAVEPFGCGFLDWLRDLFTLSDPE